METLKKLSESGAQNTQAPNSLDKTQQADGFSWALRSAIDKVSEVQSQASEMAKQYEMGTSGVALHEVMIASQKSQVSFQALTQVRNRLVGAYQEIMNMPI